MGEDSGDSRTIFVGNLTPEVTDEILYELFLQSGPIEEISIPKDKDGRNRAFGFVTYTHEVSVPYALEIYKGTKLFNRELKLNHRNGSGNSSNAPQHSNQMNPMNNNGNFGIPSLMFGFNNLQNQPLLPIAIQQNLIQQQLQANMQAQMLLAMNTQAPNFSSTPTSSRDRDRDRDRGYVQRNPRNTEHRDRPYRRSRSRSPIRRRDGSPRNRRDFSPRDRRDHRDGSRSPRRYNYRR